jgi:hypothetical protein
MTREDKELLLKDLCARLPYGVKIKIRDNDIRTVRNIDTVHGKVNFIETDINSPYGVSIEMPLTHRQGATPYLRPLSSMTEKEKMEYVEVWDLRQPYIPTEAMDWLNAHHFDYRGLIEKGLALEAPEGMYE